MALPGHINLNDLLVFEAVADMGGFTAAAERLNVAPAKVSLEIARLEAQLGVALFSRTTRKVVLTEAGDTLHQQCKPLLAQLRAAVDGLGGTSEQLSGTFRVAAPVESSDILRRLFGKGWVQLIVIDPETARARRWREDGADCSEGRSLLAIDC